MTFIVKQDLGSQVSIGPLVTIFLNIGQVIILNLSLQNEINILTNFMLAS